MLVFEKATRGRTFISSSSDSRYFLTRIITSNTSADGELQANKILSILFRKTVHTTMLTWFMNVLPA